MSEQSINKSNPDEISLKDIIFFVNQFWKTFLVFGIFGFLVAVIFCYFSPKEYSAYAQIRLAEFKGSGKENNQKYLIEDPSLLISRLKLPSTYSDKEVDACGLNQSSSPLESLAALPKVSLVKGSNSAVELTIVSNSKNRAITCLDAIFQRIQLTQSYFLQPYLNDLKVLLKNTQVRLGEARELISRADQSGSALSATYLSVRDEIKFLSDESVRINGIISAINLSQSKLVAPIFASDTQVSPDKKRILIVGVLAGLLMGILYVVLTKVCIR